MTIRSSSATSLKHTIEQNTCIDDGGPTSSKCPLLAQIGHALITSQSPPLTRSGFARIRHQQRQQGIKAPSTFLSDGRDYARGRPRAWLSVLCVSLAVIAAMAAITQAAMVRTATGTQPLCFIEHSQHDMRIGYYRDTYERTADGWRLKTRAMTFAHYRRLDDPPQGYARRPCGTPRLERGELVL